MGNMNPEQILMRRYASGMGKSATHLDQYKDDEVDEKPQICFVANINEWIRDAVEIGAVALV